MLNHSRNHTTKRFSIRFFFVAGFLLLLSSGCSTLEIKGSRGIYTNVKNIVEYCEKCLTQENCKDHSTCENNLSEEGLKYVMKLALAFDRLDTVQYLVETLNFDVNTPLTEDQGSALDFLSYCRDTNRKISRYLVSKGANVNSISTSVNNTPLLVAIRKHNNAYALFLLNNGADPSILNGRGFDACTVAYQFSNWNIMPYLPDCCDRVLEDTTSWFISREVHPPELIQTCQKNIAR
ncbi:MAG: hypothetical protein LBQ75_01585 [Zoogloeaceae bacterium]|jgi:hypothetical protein|nr:hypothetical protein [Zoogloeaceae bacterium]